MPGPGSRIEKEKEIGSFVKNLFLPSLRSFLPRSQNYPDQLWCANKAFPLNFYHLFLAIFSDPMLL